MTAKKDTAKEDGQDCTPKYSIKQLIAGVFAVLSLVGGAGYSVGAGVAKVDTQQQENGPPQEVVQSLQEIKESLKDHAQAMESMKLAQVEMSIEAKYSRTSIDTASARIDRLTRAMDRLSYKYDLGFACDNMASGPVASVKKGEM